MENIWLNVMSQPDFTIAIHSNCNKKKPVCGI